MSPSSNTIIGKIDYIKGYKVKITAEEKLTNVKIKEIQELYKICNENDGTKYCFDENCDFQRENEINTFLLYKNNKIASVLNIFAPTKKEAEITALTLPGERKNGYFGELIKCLIKELNKRKIQSILYVCDDKSLVGKEVINNHIGAKYEFSEYLMKNKKRNEIQIKNNNIKIEAANEIDLERYIEINIRAFKNEKEDTAEIIKEFFIGKKRTLYGISYKNEVIGMIGIYEEENRNYIYGFCIDPKYQRKGIGKYVLSEIVQICIRKNNKDIVLEVQTKNENALNVYKNVGFEIETEFKYYRENI